MKDDPIRPCVRVESGASIFLPPINGVTRQDSNDTTSQCHVNDWRNGPTSWPQSTKCVIDTIFWPIDFLWRVCNEWKTNRQREHDRLDWSLARCWPDTCNGQHLQVERHECEGARCVGGRRKRWNGRFEPQLDGELSESFDDLNAPRPPRQKSSTWKHHLDKSVKHNKDNKKLFFRVKESW